MKAQNARAALIHQKVSGDVIRAAMTVHNELRPGLDEKLYERALAIELREMQYQVEQQRQFNVDYKGQHIGMLDPDMIIDHKVIVDPKVVESFTDTHMAQMIGYLRITDLRLAMLINFKHAKLLWKRVVV